MSPARSPSLLAAVMIAAALSLVGTVRPAAADDIDRQNRRDAARAHASAIQQAWAALSAWIERRPPAADPDATNERAPYSWLSGPSSPGLPAAVAAIWQAEWTDRGLSFRYCDDVLAVYASDARLKGTDQRTVQTEGGLQWITGGQAVGMPQSGHPTVALPGCMSLPARRVGLVSAVTDPFGWGNTRRRNEHNDWERGCPMPGGDPAATVGEIRYSQTRPIERHPWSGADMARWPATCAERESGTFTYAGVTVPLPDHGQCAPPGDGESGDGRG